MRAERWWMIAAGVLMIVAMAALLFWWNVEAAFVSATLGIVCWFLNMRNQLKKSIVEEIKEDEVFEEEDENQ
jgi:hypothetical protein